MRSFILFGALVACVAAQQGGRQGQYVFDLLKPQLTSDQVVDILLNAQPGVSFPNYDQIPQTNFQCPQQPGFYADVATQCQVFHRCDINGNETSYLCVNTTVFNQITLVCDYFWNVDCQGSQQYANFANSRLYTDQPLFDTPPADYVAPSQLLAQQQQEQLNAQGSQQSGNQQSQGQQGQAQGGRARVQAGRTQGVVRTQGTRNTQQQGARVLGARVGAVGASQQQGQQGQGADQSQGQNAGQSSQQTNTQQISTAQNVGGAGSFPSQQGSQGRSFAAGNAQAGSSNTGTLEVTSNQDQTQQDQTQQ